MSSSPTRPAPTLFVAGVGASAGGLEAMLSMFAHTHVTGRIAYVVAQHMARDGHDELVARLIGHASALPVALARTVEPLRADTVYVIPSGHDGVVSGTMLKLRAPVPASPSTPSVNALFASIAESLGANAIGILLSGTGTDGATGCRAIRTHGGLTIAQEPAQAGFGGMPGAAIDAGFVDRVLPTEAIGDALARIFPAVVAAPAMYASTSPAGDIVPEAARRELQQLLPLVHQTTGIDFSSYKEDTLLRRLDRRKSELGIAVAEKYLALIRRHPEELHTLQRLFLVSVSSFFRDRDAYRELEHALATLLAGKAVGEPVRVWVPGCASGEEPYSLAIVIHELLGEHRNQHPISIAASDLSAEVLAMARAGIYRLTAFKEMEDSLRERYFITRGQHFEVGPELREAVAFEQRDVLSGPPAGDFDLVSCRNLLIYLKGPLQDRLIDCVHSALRPQGLLFIGSSESLGSRGDALFTAADNTHRLFRRRP